MRRTLLVIPHEVAGLPVFGFGWVLIGLAILLIVRLAWGAKRGESIWDVLVGEGPMWGIAAAVVAFALPMAEVRDLAGEPLGMAIRGYGVMLLFAVVAAVGLAAYRAPRYGVSAETIYALAPWVFIGGIAGARLFYVIQYRDHFDSLRDMVLFTEGGLVVYGGILGGFASAVVFLIRHRLPWLVIGDVIIPCIFVGIALGRIGCLMNGCCYGGRCEPGPMAIEFPPGSPVYEEQLRSGELVGLQIDPVRRVVISVRPGSLAERAGIRAGQRIDTIGTVAAIDDESDRDVAREAIRSAIQVRIEGDRFRWGPDELPGRALPVRAAQLWSSLSAAVMAGLLLVVSRWRWRPGVLMFAGFAGYAVVRFVLEIVRVDEAGRFGTELSISQWVSILVFFVSVAFVVRLASRGDRQHPASPSTS